MIQMRLGRWLVEAGAAETWSTYSVAVGGAADVVVVGEGVSEGRLWPRAAEKQEKYITRV